MQLNLSKGNESTARVLISVHFCPLLVKLKVRPVTAQLLNTSAKTRMANN